MLIFKHISLGNFSNQEREPLSEWPIFILKSIMNKYVIATSNFSIYLYSLIVISFYDYGLLRDFFHPG